MKWDIEEIRAKRDKLKSMISNELDKDSKEIIVSSYFAYDGMLFNSGSIRYTHFYNAINILTFNKFHLVKEKEKREIFLSTFDNDGVKFELDFINQLFEIFKGVLSNKYDMTPTIFSRAYFTKDKLIDVSKDFYRQLDLELYSNVLRILDPKNKTMNFNNSNYTNDGINVFGRTFYDNYHDKVYCTVRCDRTYIDLISTAHELMHANQYFYNNKLLQYRFPYVGEIEPKVIELLMLDYLIDNGYDQLEIEKIKVWRNQQLVYSSYLIVDYVKRAREKNMLQDVNYVNSDFVMASMTALTSLVAYYIYKEIKINKQVGINKLKKVMKEPIMMDEQPKFDFIGLDFNELLEIAKNITKISVENNKEMKYNINR